MSNRIKPPLSFWIIAILAILWNLIEIYFGSLELTFFQENLTTQEFEKIQSIPTWYSIVFIIAICSEMIGSFMLFMRRKIANSFFLISLATLILMEIYWLSLFDIKITSPIISIIIPFVVIVIAVFLYQYSKKAIEKGWIQ